MLAKQLDQMENMSFDEHVNMLIHRGDVVHTVDRGWLNTASNVLDTVGIVSMVGWVTGTNFVTREILTPDERSSAGFTAATNVGFFVIGVATGGGGTLVAKVAVNISTSMLSGVASVATAGILDHMGAPSWAQGVASAAAGFATGFGAGRLIDVSRKARTASQVGGLARQNGLTVDQLNDIRRGLPTTQNLSDADFIRLLNEKPLDELLGLSELNSGFITDVARRNGLTVDQLNDVRRHLPDTQNLNDADFARLLSEKPLDELLGLPELDSAFITEIAGRNGLTIDQLNDVRRHLPDTQNLSDADFARLLSENPLDELLGLPELNQRLIPGTPGVVERGNSTRLGKNMLEEMGVARSQKWTGYQAQHIIPTELANHPALQRIGMQMDDVSNGMFLRTPDQAVSTMSRHTGYHSVYSRFVERKLGGIDLNQSIRNIEIEVHGIQTTLRRVQESGLPLYRHQGASIELWERFFTRLR